MQRRPARTKPNAERDEAAPAVGSVPVRRPPHRATSAPRRPDAAPLVGQPPARNGTRAATPRDARAADAAGPGSRGHAARERLLQVATRAFADRGYAGASTREIADAAGANVSAIAYYFGGKEGLYREVLLRPVRDIVHRLPPLDADAAASRPLHEQLKALYSAFLEPMASGDEAMALHMRVHLREMVEPSSLLLEVFERDIAPHHHALVMLLARHCGAAGPDDDLHQLAFALIAMVNDYWMSQDCIRVLAPGVLDRPQAIRRVIDRLTDYGLALVAFEAERRRQGGPKRAAASTTAHKKRKTA